LGQKEEIGEHNTHTKGKIGRESRKKARKKAKTEVWHKLVVICGSFSGEGGRKGNEQLGDQSLGRERDDVASRIGLQMSRQKRQHGEEKLITQAWT